MPADRRGGKTTPFQKLNQEAIGPINNKAAKGRKCHVR